MFIKTIKVLRNNWKKSVFFSCVTVWAVNYGNNKLIEHKKMRSYCEEAVLFGQQYLRPDQKCRHVTVLLNPVANGRKSKANYDKFCAPLLHLAGIRVSLVVTEAEGQAMELMEIMDNTDAVLIAGGNGTVHEAVTGLLRRPDNWSAINRMPIGILPVGKRNTIAFDLNRFRERNLKHYEVLAESTMSAIKELLKPIDVMKIEGQKGRPVFALQELSFGKMRDTFASVDKYWYFGNKLKPYLALICNSFKRLSSVENIDVSYSEPCAGCSKCFERFEALTADGRTADSREPTRWWHIFVSRKTDRSNNSNENQSKVDLKSVINEKCGQWSALEDITAANIQIKNSNECKLSMLIHREPLAQTQFINDGIMLYNSQPLPQTTGSGVQMIDAMDINIDLKTDNTSSGNSNNSDFEEASDGSEDKMRAKDNLPNDQWFSIDTESYERQSVRITLMPRALHIYGTPLPVPALQ